MSVVFIAKYNIMCRIRYIHTMVSSRQERWTFDKIKTSHNIAPETDNKKVSMSSRFLFKIQYQTISAGTYNFESFRNPVGDKSFLQSSFSQKTIYAIFEVVMETTIIIIFTYFAYDLFLIFISFVLTVPQKLYSEKG